MDMLQSVMEASSQAMFTLDREGTITHINQQTKDYFGLFNHSRHSHGPGRLERGDLVIIADTSIGADDGNLSPADLERLNIRDRKLRAGDRQAGLQIPARRGRRDAGAVHRLGGHFHPDFHRRQGGRGDCGRGYIYH